MRNLVGATLRLARVDIALAILLTASLISTMGVTLVWAVLAVYASSLGASTATVGLLVAAFSAARLLVNVPAGQLSTKFGYARVMSVGLAVLAAGSVLPYATADIAVLALGVVVQGLGSSLFSTSVLVAIAALSTPESRVRDMSTYQGAQVVGVALGPALGGMVASLWGYPATFLWQAGLALAALAAVVAVRRRIPSAPQTAPGAAAVPGAAIPMGPFAAVGLMTFALLATRVATAWLIMPLLAQARWGASAGEVGLILTAGALATSATLPVVPRLSRKFGRGTAIAGSTAMVLAGLWFVGTAATIVGMTFGSLLLGIANALGIPALSAYAVDLTPPGRLGAAMGLLRMATDGGVVFGPIVLGLMVDQLGLGYGGALVWAGAWLLACNTAFAAAMRGHKAPRG